MIKRLNNKRARLIYVIVPPLIITLFIFLYFFKWYKNSVSRVDINTVDADNAETVVTEFDPLGIKNLFPSLVGENIGFVLCLYNRNTLFMDDKLVDPNSLPLEFGNIKNNIGAMSIRASLIPDLKIYNERGHHLCVPIDMKKLTESRVTAEVNHGGLATAYLTEQESKSIADGKQIQVAFKPAYVDTSKTLLFARIQWSNLGFILVSIYVAWFGLVLLLREIYRFIIGKNKL